MTRSLRSPIQGQHSREGDSVSQDSCRRNIFETSVRPFGSVGFSEPVFHLILQPRLQATWTSSATGSNPHATWCVQRKLACSVGDSPTKVSVRGLEAWIAGRKETEFLKPIDKAIFGMVSKSSGRNESERIGGLESAKFQRPSPPRRGEGSMDRRSLTDAASHSGGVIATAR
jgi:hypothetical protein